MTQHRSLRETIKLAFEGKLVVERARAENLYYSFPLIQAQDLYYASQRHSLDHELRNQGLMPSHPAYQMAMNILLAGQR